MILIDKLTPEQDKLIPECRDYWIKKGLQTGETDFETFETNIKLAYKKANIPFPNKIIRVKSPIVGALVASLSDRIFNINLTMIKKYYICFDSMINTIILSLNFI